MRWWIAVSLIMLNVTVGLAADRVLDARSQLQQACPEVQFWFEGGRLAQVYGTAFGYGLSAEQSADNFVRTYAEAFGVTPEELLPGSAFSAQYTLPLMYNEDTRTYACTAVYYRQYEGGLPVYGADLRLLVDNKPGYPLLLANSGLYDLGDWQATAGAAVPQEGAAHAAAAAFAPGLINFSDSELVIWPGSTAADKPSAGGGPRVAITFVADNGRPATGYYQKWRFVSAAATGEILHTENLILNTNVTGSVHGLATTPPKADICNPEVDTPMPYAKVAIGSTTAYADASGNFTIPNGGSSPVTVTSYMSGQYFVVSDQGGPLETLTMTVTPPGPANFMHNAANTSEFIRAEVNGYIQANVVRGWALVQNPLYPVIASQTNFPVNVNINDSCNAYYDYSSINFFRSGNGCPNTAYSNIVHHEYGHHLVASGGSGQGAYGEGMSDCAALLIADDPVEGYGFQGDCNAGIRSAENTIPYPCSGEIHYCGQLLSGCVWDTRQELDITTPDTALAIISMLTVNSIPLHTGSGIDPSIYNTFIALDDACYGGVHHAEITTGFGNHEMLPPPPPANDLCADAFVACPGQTYTGYTTSGSVDGATTCGLSDQTPDVWYKYTPATSGSAHFTMCTGTYYDSVLSIHTGCPGTPANTLGCNDDACGQPYDAPSEVTLSVTAGTTYVIRISGWNGKLGLYGLTIVGPACQQTDYTLTTTIRPPGGSYPPATTVQLTATAATGWHFDHWSGDLGGTANPISITMGGDRTVTAVFGLLADLTCDGVLDFGDINPFVLAITDPVLYQATFPDCFILHGDFNSNGAVDFGDINPFVDALTP